MINKTFLYWHTLRHLRLSQFYERLKFNLFHPKPDSSPPPALRPYSGFWVMPIKPSPSLIGLEEFSFLGEQGSLELFGWDGPAREKLWRYNQHYFNDLNASSASERNEWHLALLKNWVEQNPPALGVGWEPYPISLRMVNWIKWYLAGNTLPTLCIQSLAIQARFLSKRLEWHLLGNHLLANAKALVFAGLFFQGDEATAWLKTGLRIIESELAEQVLQDGGHFERSPMYHAIVLEDLLDLINASQLWSASIDSSVILGWRAIARRMFFWLGAMTHPDGQISFFNDAAFDIAPSLKNLSEYAESLGIKLDFNLARPGLTAYKLDQSGYIQLRSRDAVAFLDVALIGPDYLLGHAHADTLSFEMSIFNQRVIVNGGTSRYGLGPDRLRERQTVSHSTVEVNSLSSSEVWSGFRVARRAYPFDLELSGNSAQVAVSCSHDGYKYLRGKPVHRRTWLLRENAIEVRDVIQGPYSQAIARFILHPDIAVSEVAQGVWELRLPQGDLITFVIEKGTSQLERAFYAPEFGKVLLTQCLSVHLEHGISSVHMRWS